MLKERKGRAVSYDAKAKTARVTVSSGGDSSTDTQGTVLLDASGAVVGVDVEPSSPGRIVVMVGSHESVARTVARKLTVTRDGAGEVTELVVHDVNRPG